MMQKQAATKGVGIRVRDEDESAYETSSSHRHFDRSGYTMEHHDKTGRGTDRHREEDLGHEAAKDGHANF